MVRILILMQMSRNRANHPLPNEPRLYGSRTQEDRRWRGLQNAYRALRAST